MSSTNVMTVLIQDREELKYFSPSKSMKVIELDNFNETKSTPNLFVLASFSGLSKVAEIVRVANNKHHLRALFVREDIDSKWLPQVFDQANLRIMRNTFIHKNQELPQRVINAWLLQAQDVLIAEAIALRDHLLVFSCALEKLEISFDSLPALKRIEPEDWPNFELDADGSYLYWKKADIHLDLDALRCAVDPVWKQKAEAIKLSHDQAFGQAIATLRKQHKLRQSDIVGLSARQVSRIENGEGTKLETLELLAKVHNLEINDYLEAIANLMTDVSSNYITLEEKRESFSDWEDLMGDPQEIEVKYHRFTHENQNSGDHN
ncbi:hypothetical protein NIES970_21990 [[Synechococcus] sp. NIES-970]|nr:hypothetical protein NIES970_21990 [[Synechococcus] sp. NIES-970]